MCTWGSFAFIQLSLSFPDKQDWPVFWWLHWQCWAESRVLELVEPSQGAGEQVILLQEVQQILIHFFGT